jgi:hypothetical protein
MVRGGWDKLTSDKLGTSRYQSLPLAFLRVNPPLPPALWSPDERGDHFQVRAVLCEASETRAVWQLVCVSCQRRPLHVLIHTF